MRMPILVGLFALACGGASPDRGARSPSGERAEPARSAADGEVLGADGVAPSDKLGQSPRVGSDGVHGAGSPHTDDEAAADCDADGERPKEHAVCSEKDE